MLVMTVTINSRIRAVYRGFFQDCLYVDNEMHVQGFKVACEGFGASSHSTMGRTYAYSIVAEDCNRARAVALPCGWFTCR